MSRLIRQSSASLRIGLQESDPSDSHSVELESKESTKEGTPVGLRTRSRVQQQQTVSNNFNEEGSDKPIESEIKELLLQLISQAKEQQLEMKELRQVLTKGLEQQESIVHGLKEDITALHKQIQSQEEKKIEVHLPISDHPPLVRPLTRSVKLSIEESPRPQELSADAKKDSRDSPNLDDSVFSLKLAGKQDGIQKADPSTLRAKAYMARTTWQSPSNDIDSSESNSRSSIESDMTGDVPQDTSSNLGSFQPNSRLSTSSNMSYETKSSMDTRSPRGYIRLSSKQSQSPQHSEHPTSRTRSWGRGGELASKSRAEAFVPPKASDKARKEADQMIEEALNQVPNAVHFDTKCKEIEVTLYAGNLDFGAHAEDVIESLQKCLRRRIRVSKVVIPNSKGRTKGYAFVTLAWARDALVDPADICKFYSGMVPVKSRELYFQELHDDVADKKERERARSARLIGLPQEVRPRGYYCTFTDTPGRASAQEGNATTLRFAPDYPARRGV